MANDVKVPVTGAISGKWKSFRELGFRPIS